MNDPLDVVHEGFLCPVCKKNCFSTTQLQLHFNDAHGEVAQTEAPASQLRDLFGWAKNRIFKQEAQKVAIQPSTSSETILGVSTSLTRYFKKLRSANVDQSVVQTNKLIIRLDKLVNGTVSASDSAGKRAFEKEVVPWISNEEARQCAFCGASFSLSRRRHHCRLCGSVQCGRCSVFMPIMFAQRLVNPAFAATSKLEDGLLKSSGSSSSLNTIEKFSAGAQLMLKAGRLLTGWKRFTQEAADKYDIDATQLAKERENTIRICRECDKLLLRRQRQQEQSSEQPFIVTQYENFVSLVNEVKKKHQSYLKVNESLCAGEAVYELDFGHQLRNKIINMLKQVDSLSENILSLTPAEAGTRWSSQQLLLQRNIRLFAVDFIQRTTSELPSLPSANQFKEISAERKENIRQDFDRTSRKYAEIMDEGRELRNALQSHGKSVYGPLSNGQLDNVEDPLQQQITLIRKYIKQAAMSGDVYEVDALKKNLDELEAEFAGRRNAWSDESQLL
uniref:FYVE-type domain-containing protein n=1 Tax=Trichuris muris TaxID=70415 RepID=A0A5S6QW56_TRIMR